jgi:hypothetical protein
MRTILDEILVGKACQGQTFWPIMIINKLLTKTFYNIGPSKIPWIVILGYSYL